MSAQIGPNCLHGPIDSQIRWKVVHRGSRQNQTIPRNVCLWSVCAAVSDTSKAPSNQQRVLKKGQTARGIAVDQLLRIEEEGGFVGRVSSSGKGPRISGDEQRKSTAFVAEVTRLKRRLDWRLARLTDRPLAQMEPRLLQILRMGGFEIFERDLAGHAINEYVKLAQATVGPWSRGFVNAVLREACRKRDAGDLMLPSRPSKAASSGEWAEALAVVYSHPTWMVHRWLTRFGLHATEHLLQANNRTPKYGLRVNTLKCTNMEHVLQDLREGGATVEVSQWLPDEFICSTTLQPILKGGVLKQGSCMVQDEAAGLVVAMLDPQPGEAILDACAAPGGKTLFAAARMQNQGHLVAMDIYENRLKPLARAADACGVGPMLQILPGGLDNLTVKRIESSRSWLRNAQEAQVEDTDLLSSFYDDLDWTPPLAQDTSVQSQPSLREATSAGENRNEDQADGVPIGRSIEGRPQFDRVLLDVPCSGHGVLSKRADLRWRRRPEDLEQLATLQAELLHQGSQFVKLGGLLVYSTCSIEPEENEDQIQQFLKAHPEFEIDSPPESLPADVLEGKCLKTFPSKHKIDGAFAARLRRRAEG